MKEYTSKISYIPHKLPGFDYPLEDIMYFDIETTGFVANSTILYMIGFIEYSDGAYLLTQLFADTVESEAEIIRTFLARIKAHKVLVHYNGSGFDLPYIEAKCKLLGIPFDIEGSASIDIYKYINPLKKIFKLNNIKQKTIEKYIGLNRTDKFSGGELIEKYYEYIKHPNDGLLRLLLCHNREDLSGMLCIDSMLSYNDLLAQDFEIEKTELVENSGKKEVHIYVKHPNSFPVNISFGNDLVHFTAVSDTIKFSIEVYDNELKYYYPNYKDYYYLPEEDRSIHKSVAFFVDKNFRTRAKAANCYSKKTGTFLPQYDEIVSPYFKIDYHDKLTYFEFTEDFKENNRLIVDYIQNLIRHLISS